MTGKETTRYRAGQKQPDGRGVVKSTIQQGTSKTHMHSLSNEREGMTHGHPRKDRRCRAAASIKRHRVAQCPRTGKLRYRDAKQAKEALRSVRETRQQDERDGRGSRRRE